MGLANTDTLMTGFTMHLTILLVGALRSGALHSSHDRCMVQLSSAAGSGEPPPPPFRLNKRLHQSCMEDGIQKGSSDVGVSVCDPLWRQQASKEGSHQHCPGMPQQTGVSPVCSIQT